MVLVSKELRFSLRVYACVHTARVCVHVCDEEGGIKQEMSLRSQNSDLIGGANLIVREQWHCSPLPAKCMLIMRFALDKTLVGHSAVVICH